MDIQVLSNFLAVAREGNITRAAGLLHVTQPTLSRQIKNLEAELGVKLLVRRKYDVVLTEEGAIFRRRAQEIVTLAGMVADEVASVDREMSGAVVVGCNESASMGELAGHVLAFRKLHPLVTFDIRSGDNDDVRGWIDNGIVDVGLLCEPVDTSRYEHVRMRGRDEWGVLLASSHPLAGRPGASAAELASVPMVTVRDEAVHAELTSWSGRYAARMAPVAHYNLLPNAVPLLADGESVAVCSRPACEFPGVEFVPFDPPLSLGSLACWKGQQVHARASAAFIAYLEERAG